MTADFDTIRTALTHGAEISHQYRDYRYAQAISSLARVQDAAEQAEKALANLVEHIDLNGGCHRGCPEHDDARAALKLLRGKDTG